MKNYIVLSLICLFGIQAKASNTEYYFFVQFIDKDLNYVDINKPEKFLSERCLERRERLGIPVDSADLPVTKSYIDNIVKPSINVKYVSKWLNGAVISTPSMDSAYRLKIKFYVDDVIYLGKDRVKTLKSGTHAEQNAFDENEIYGNGFEQLNMLNGPNLHKLGYTGESMMIAVFDAGFKRANELSLFKHLFDDNRMVYQYDLVDMEPNVFNDDDHGLHVLGCMAANKEGKMIGGAPDASYVLIRTESDRYESWLEELHWVRAAEIADSMGVDIINSSLGYNTFDEKRLNHTHDDLDGKTTFISRGAAFAASRGILVVNSAGNDGNKSWGKLDFPADVEDILVIGAVNRKLESPAFSSPGPTADFRLKPDISALGQSTTVSTTYGVGTGNGTSYSSPIIAGLMACLWQAAPNLTSAQLREIIIHTGHLYLEPDNAMGHGIPDFNLALAMTQKHPAFDYSGSFIVNESDVNWTSGNPVHVYANGSRLSTVKMYRPKRFLMFKYKGQKWSSEIDMNAWGFGQVKLPVSNYTDGFEVEFSTMPNNGKPSVFYSTSVKLK